MHDRRAHANMRLVAVGKREPKPLLGGLLPSIPIVDPLLDPIIDPIVTPILGGGAQPTTNQPPTTQPTPPAQTTAANPPSPTTTPSSPTSGSGGQSGDGQSGNGQSGNGQSGNGQSGNGQSGNGQSGNQSGNGQSGTGQSGNGNGNDSQGGQSGNGNGSGSGNGTGTGTGNSSGSGQTGNGGGGNSQGAGNGGGNTSAQTGNGTRSQGNSGSSTSAGGNGAVLVNAGSQPGSESTPTGQNYSNPTMSGTRPNGSSAPAAGSKSNTPTNTGVDGGNNTGGSEGNGNVQGGSKSTGLAPGAIAGIVIACVIALILAVVLFRRRRFITHRLKRRNQWQHSAVESSTYPFDNHNRDSLSPPSSARSSFATTHDHSIPPTPQMAELRDTHGPGTFSQRNAEFPNQLSPRSPPPVPLLIDIERTTEFFSATSPGAKSRNSVNSSSSDPYTMGQVLYTNDNLGLPPQPNTPMSVRPFSPTEAFSFPKPPPSNEFSLNKQQHDDPFADSPTIPIFKPPEVVKRPFNPTKDDELLVQAGDRVSIIQLFDDGWVAVRKVEEHEGKGKGKAASGPGLIPIDCFREQGQPLPDSLAGLRRVSASSGGYVA